MAGYYDRDRNTRWPDGSPNFDSDNPVGGTMNHAYSHHMNSNEYIASGTPFVHTQTIADSGWTAGSGGKYKDRMFTVTFPYVTRWLMIRVTEPDGTTAATDIKIGFGIANSNTEGVASTNYVTTAVTNGVRLELKCKKLYFVQPGSDQGEGAHTVEIIAGLTNVRDFPVTTDRYISGITSSTKEGTTTTSNGTVTATDFTVFSTQTDLATES